MAKHTDSGDLVKFWQGLNVQREFGAQPPLYLHPRDLPLFQEHRPSELKALRDARPGRGDTFNHLSLLPMPYIGDLGHANIFVLMRNPGFSAKEYEIEARHEIHKGLADNLRQDFADDKPRFWYFSPGAKDHPGYEYWYRRFGIATSEENLRSKLEQRLAVIQWYPYHSKKFAGACWLHKLPSVCAAKQYVTSSILPRAREGNGKGKVLVIVARAATDFGIEPSMETDNLVIYTGGEPRGAWLTPKTRGGARIRRWLEENP